MPAITTVNGSLLGSKFQNDVTESRGVRSHPFIAHSDRRGARDPVDFSVPVAYHSIVVVVVVS